jgi:hypothetical protein
MRLLILREECLRTTNRRRLSPTMRQTHVAGDKLFVDWAGDTVRPAGEELFGLSRPELAPCHQSRRPGHPTRFFGPFRNPDDDHPVAR